eukprot:CAMPEP_0177451626 /NCGR_PEP_ID=MMETSP0369-20130122/9874_1 /TAXON_ID=447022 ORGANISM="Scrippsiella hangoei-like, Strain SHHI-4" /NCGR_SAMPLE_ID=MMETSP0369 /ASSEMBLY_ACC=CAM_ASM_000364 /LENGTH=314 /DNA_ID=CAMNT_0018924243 /DNA_START=1 /DNA_END=949 /DNA_ORIENTATION=+
MLFGILLLATWTTPPGAELTFTQRDGLRALYEFLIPSIAGTAVLVTVVLLARSAAPKLHPKFGRKCLAITTCAVLFAFSCFYRALFVADEGAALCRGVPSAFNAPASGRTVATVGEVALVVQLALYIEGTAQRLGAKRGKLWGGAFERVTTLPFSTPGPVIVAECCSWTGVLSGKPWFYCIEYMFWCVIAVTWLWDGAELLHKSLRVSDKITHAALTVGAAALLGFNLLHEIPHFLFFRKEDDSAAVAPPSYSHIWTCAGDAQSPLWLKRLPFFVDTSWVAHGARLPLHTASHAQLRVASRAVQTDAFGLEFNH